jgi:uncharacterized protein
MDDHNASIWYRNGLRFACTGCGGCCTGAPGYVWVNKMEIARLAAGVGLSVERFQQEFVRLVGVRRSLIEFANGDCVFFDPVSRRCKVYLFRPRQCETWPFWASNLRTPEHWDEMASRCPGANRGKRVPLAKIESCLNVVNV